MVIVKFCKVTQWLPAISTLDSHWEHKQSWKFAGDSTKHIFLTTLLKVQIMYKNYKKPDKLAIKTKLTWEESQHVFTLDPEKTCLSDSWITLKVVLVLSI